MKNISLFYKSRYKNGVFTPLQTVEFIHALKLDLPFYEELERLDYELTNDPRHLTNYEITVIINCILNQFQNTINNLNFLQYCKNIIEGKYTLLYNSRFLEILSIIELPEPEPEPEPED